MGLGKYIKKGLAAINPGSAIASVAGDVIGGFMAQKENLRANQQADEMFQKNYDMQREFAQNGIKWKVADGASVGLSPLASIGATTFGAGPILDVTQPDHSMSDMVSRMGQDISRAVMATQTKAEREHTRLLLEGASIDNEMKKAQLASMVAKLNNQVGPGVPMQDWEYMRDDNGRMYKVPSLDWVKRNWMLPFAPTGWQMRNYPDLGEAFKGSFGNKEWWTEERPYKIQGR